MFFKNRIAFIPPLAEAGVFCDDYDKPPNSRGLEKAIKKRIRGSFGDTAELIPPQKRRITCSLSQAGSFLSRDIKSNTSGSPAAASEAIVRMSSS